MAEPHELQFALTEIDLDAIGISEMEIGMLGSPLVPTTEGSTGTGKDGREVELRRNESGTLIQWRYSGDAQWRNLVSVAELAGPAGTNGKSAQFQNNGVNIQWRLVGDANWINLVALDDITGPSGSDGTDGTDGREVALRLSSGMIQWQYVGSSTWTDLVSVASLSGPPGLQGADGNDGTNGTNGTNGREVQLRNNSTHIQWRYAGDVSWINLVALSEITGPPGSGGSGSSLPSLTGNASKVLAVKTDETSTEWITAPSGSGGGSGGVSAETRPNARFWRVRCVSNDPNHTPVNDGLGFSEFQWRNAAGSNLCTGGAGLASTTEPAATWAISEAFDGIPATSNNGWYSGTNQVGSWLGYDFGSAVQPYSVSFSPLMGFNWTIHKELTVEYSDDAVFWKTLGTISTSPGTGGVMATYALPTLTVSQRGGAVKVFPALAALTYDAVGNIILASTNIVSVTVLTSGVYKINFTTPMPDTNYTISGMAKYDDFSNTDNPIIGVSRDTTLTHWGKHVDYVVITLMSRAGALFRANFEIIIQSAVSVNVGDSDHPWDFSPPLVSGFPTSVGTVPPTLANDPDVGLLIDMGAPAGGDVVRAWIKPINNPAGDWTVIAKFVQSSMQVNYGGLGLFLYDSVAGRCIMPKVELDSIPNINVARFSVPSGFNSNPFILNFNESIYWFKVVHDATTNNYSFYYSRDGKSWILLLQESDTAWLTNRATSIGIGGFYNRANIPANRISGSVPFWSEIGL